MGIKIVIYYLIFIKQKTSAKMLRLLLGYQGSNLDKQNQNLLCYRYTITQFVFRSAKIGIL